MDDFRSMFFLLQLGKFIRKRKRIRAQLALENEIIHNENFKNKFSPCYDFENVEFDEITDESENNSEKSSIGEIDKKRKQIPKYNPAIIRTSLSNDEIILNKIKIVKNVTHINPNPVSKPYNKENEMCEICGIIIRRRNMDYHMNTHLNKKPFVCNYKNCRKSFASRSTLYNHKRLHTTIKNFKCDICSATFHFNGNLQKHKATHLAPKFKCTVCNRMFKTKDHLNYHMYIHKEPEEVACTFPSCNRIFANRYRVKDHLRRFHNIKINNRVSRPNT